MPIYGGVAPRPFSSCIASSSADGITLEQSASNRALSQACTSSSYIGKMSELRRWLVLMCILISRVLPSSVAVRLIRVHTSLKSMSLQSVGSPSVMFITMGGKLSRLFLSPHHSATISRTLCSASCIGVVPSARGFIHSLWRCLTRACVPSGRSSSKAIVVSGGICLDSSTTELKPSRGSRLFTSSPE